MTWSLFSHSYFQSNLCQHLELPHPLVYLDARASAHLLPDTQPWLAGSFLLPHKHHLPVLCGLGTPGGWPGFFPLRRHLCVSASPSHSSCSGVNVGRAAEMQQKGCPQRGPQGQVGGPCKDVGFGFKDGRNFQKACLLKDRMSSRLHSCEF